MPAMASFDDAKVEQGVRLILEGIGEDLERGGSAGSRVARMYREIAGGVGADATGIVTVVEGADFDEMIMVRDIPLYSICEQRHPDPVQRSSATAYVPNKAGQITGLSKIARVVDVLAKKPQVQERLTTEIADTIERALEPRGCSFHDRGRAPVHDDARHQEAGLRHRHLGRPRTVPHRRPHASKRRCASSIGMR